MTRTTVVAMPEALKCNCECVSETGWLHSTPWAASSLTTVGSLVQIKRFVVKERLAFKYIHFCNIIS